MEGTQKRLISLRTGKGNVHGLGIGISRIQFWHIKLLQLQTNITDALLLQWTIAQMFLLGIMPAKRLEVHVRIKSYQYSNICCIHKTACYRVPVSLQDQQTSNTQLVETKTLLPVVNLTSPQVLSPPQLLCHQPLMPSGQQSDWHQRETRVLSILAQGPLCSSF